VIAGSTDASGLPAEVVGALGGDANLRTVHALHGRFRVELADPARVDEGALVRITHGIARPQTDVCHILL
jgi:PTS system N-acetylglucosamine-specific IIC component